MVKVMAIPAQFEHIPFNLIVKISKDFNVCPYLIAAIGQHETGWGKLVDHPLYTGYGAFDHGFDYRFAGEERQIRGTARMMREWGMRPGNVTLERLKKGNRGEFGRIYATDPNWPYGVWRWYNRIRDAVDLRDIAPVKFDKKEIERDEIEIEKEEPWKFYVVRIVAILLLILIIVWGFMRIFR